MIKKIKSRILGEAGIRQTAIKNTFWLTLGNVISKILRAVIIIYAARVLGTEGYGVFSYVVSVAAFFTIFSDIGLTPLLTREAVKKPEELQKYLATTLVLKLLILSVTIIATITIAPLFTKISEARALIPLIAFLLAFDSLRGFGYSITRAKNRMDLEAFFTVLTDIVITGLGIAGLMMSPTPAILATSYTVGSGVGFLLLFIAIFKEYKNLIGNFDSTIVAPILKSSWPFAVMGLLGSFMINIDIIIIGWFRTANELGLYGAAQRLVQILYVVPALIGGAIFPIVSDLVQKNEEEKIRKITEESLTAIMAVALPITLGGVMLAEPMIRFIFGANYVDATPAMQILILTVLFVFPGVLIGNTIFAYDKQKIFILSTGLGAGANVVLDLLLIPFYGIAGSAVATVISQTITNGINWVKLKSIHPFSFIKNIKIIMLSTVLMGIAIFLLELTTLHVVGVIVVAGAFYLILLKLLGEPLLRRVGM